MCLFYGYVFIRVVSEDFYIYEDEIDRWNKLNVNMRD